MEVLWHDSLGLRVQFAQTWTKRVGDSPRLASQSILSVYRAVCLDITHYYLIKTMPILWDRWLICTIIDEISRCYSQFTCELCRGKDNDIWRDIVKLKRRLNDLHGQNTREDIHQWVTTCLWWTALHGQFIACEYLLKEGGDPTTVIGR